VLFFAWGLGWRAAALAGFLAASAATGDPMGWGGYPQLIGLGLLPLFLLALDRFLMSRRLVNAFPPAVLLLAVFATSDLVGPLAAVVGIMYLVIRYAMLLARREANSLRNVALGIGVTALFLVPMAPTYLTLLPGVSATEHAKMDSPAPVLDAIGAFNGITVDLPWFWAIGFLLAVIAPVALATKRYRLALICTTVLVPASVLLIWLGESRFAYFLPVAIVIGLGSWWEQVVRLPAWSRPTLDAVVVAFLLIDVLVGTPYFAVQRDYYTVVNPGVAQGIYELQRVSRVSQVTAVSPAANDWEWGWWVEGVARRPTVYAGNPIWLTSSDERTRNALANHIFADDSDVRESVRRAQAAGIAYLIVNKEWSGYTPWVEPGLQGSSGEIVYENGSVVIIATTHG